jgi:hypothetical protein
MEILGYVKGETCNRESCLGVIDATEKEGSCSCHISPPCGYCTEQTEYCPACEWSASEEEKRHQPTAEQLAAWERERNEWAARHEEFLKKFHSLDPVSKFDYRAESHTHFSMRAYGMYPPDMTAAQIADHVRGTFGGRFTRFGNGRFEYIAYTD